MSRVVTVQWTCDATGKTADTEQLPDGWVTIDVSIAISGLGSQQGHFDVSSASEAISFVSEAVDGFLGGFKTDVSTVAAAQGVV